MSKKEEILHKLSTEDRNYIKKKFKDLETKLAEKDKVIENLRVDLKDWQDLEEKLGTKYDKVVEQLAEKDAEVQSWTDGTMVVKLCKLEEQLAENERKYEVLYKLFSEQHEIIDQYELECFEEVNRLLKEQKDFYVVEKDEYDKMVSGAKQFAKETAIAELEKIINFFEPYENSEKDTILCANNGISFLEYIDQQIKSLKGEK